jgi:hypothetical protein
MLHIFLSNRPDRVRYGSTGWPVPGYDIELRGDDGGPVPDGEPGDLYIHGPSAAMMYWGNRTKTRETFQGGWTKSGDKYVRNADGSYTYSGRSDDMLKVSGIYVSPFEVEATLVQHPAVLEAAVIGVPDAEGLTKTKAFVVLKAGAEATDDELKAFVKDKLAPYKYPRQIAFVAELPKTATGKIQRFKLRDEGLGSVSMWRDFPGRLCAVLGWRGLVYSRPGYGRRRPARPTSTGAPTSCTARPTNCCPRCWPPWACTAATACSATATAAASPCCMPRASPTGWTGSWCWRRTSWSRPVSLSSIRQARDQYINGDLHGRLARHHADVDSAFFGWNDIWLAPAFLPWDLRPQLPYIRCPVLAIQGVDDVYGTMAQIDGIAAALPGTRLLKLPACGHSPHRDQPEAVVAACQGFLAGVPSPQET